MLSSQRHEQALDHTKGFLAMYGAAGKRVYRFEWQNVKRVLQPSLKYAWRPARMTDAAFYRKLYRLGEDYESWDVLSDAKPRSTSSKQTPSAAIQTEYLHATFNRPEQVYSYSVQRETVDADGGVEQVTEQVIFQVISVITPQNRPKLVPTVGDDDDVIKTARIAVQLQHLGVWSKVSDSHLTCFFETEPEYRNIHDVLPSFRVASESLHLWDAEDSDVSNCIDILAPTLNHTKFDALGQVPVWVPLERLKSLGWGTVSRTVVHTAESEKVLDHRAAPSKLYYFQCLLQLPDLVTVNEQIHSGQPQSYYVLVLRKVKAEPNLGHQTYLKDVKRICGLSSSELKALPAPDVPCIGDGDAGGDSDSDDGGFEMGGGAAPALPPRLGVELTVASQ
jgi:hypothetical protein